MKTYGENMREMLAKLDQIFDGQKKLLVIMHNHPDPDALASALAFSYLTQKRYNAQTDIVYGGLIGRAENQAMVQELKIPLKQINRIRYSSYDRIALVDTQPGAGNNSLPLDVECHIVIDHHPRRYGVKAALILLNPQIGATATIIIQLLETCEFPFSTDLATALTYAIRSETLDLGREASDQDVKAYFTVYPKASISKLARIARPKLPRSYFVVLANTLERARVFRNLICVHLDQVPVPETVAEMADTLLRHQRISWVLCTGRFKKNLFLSLRSSDPKAKAGKLIEDLVPDRNNAGGHDLFAGGRIEIPHLQEAEIDILEIRLSQQFAKLLGYKNADWKPLLENS